MDTPHENQKCTVLVLMDLATKFNVNQDSDEVWFVRAKTETTEQLLVAFTHFWLQDKPKPVYLIRRKELSDFNIVFDPPAPKESWAHGLLERAVQEVKEVASKIRLSNTDLTPETVLALATHALNSTEYVQGYTPFQRVYGAQPTLTDEDIASFSLSPDDAAGLNYGALLKKREEAENVARYVKAMRTINKIKNSKVRQPLQTFHPMDLVTIWRKSTSPVGPRGGLKKTARPQWLGPGRVVSGDHQWTTA